MKTFIQKEADALKQRNWVLVDATNMAMGRLASEIVRLVRGKNKVNYTPHVDGGDFVVVTNAEKVRLSGNKANTKSYFWHSGYMGHIKNMPAGKMIETKPEHAVRLAIKRMLPRGPMGYAMLTKVKIYRGSAHTHLAQKPEVVNPSSSRKLRVAK